MKQVTRVLVTGAGGFIGHHLVNRLKAEGHWVRGVDVKYPEYQASAAMSLRGDLSRWNECLMTSRDSIDEVYNLAADMGGIGYISVPIGPTSRTTTSQSTRMCWRRLGSIV